MKHTFYLAVLLITLMLSAFMVNATEPIAVAEGAAVAVATVVSVDEKTRDITLAGPEGDHWTFTAGPEVLNFAQIKRGDRVITSYFAGFAIGLGPKGSGVKDRLDTMEVDRAKKGEKPGVTLSKTILAVGVVKDVNIKDRIVVLEGVKNTVALKVSEEVDISEIKVGGEVEAVYIESYAINLVPAPEVSGTVTLESTSVAIGIGVTWGHGVLTMHDGTIHKFKVNGLSIVDLGISKISATGEVFNLVEAKDLNGTFITSEAGITIVGGGSVSAMKNSKNVIIQLKSSQKGLKLTVAPGGMGVKLVE
jgi:hypothetical protein